MVSILNIKQFTVLRKEANSSLELLNGVKLGLNNLTMNAIGRTAVLFIYDRLLMFFVGQHCTARSGKDEVFSLTTQASSNYNLLGKQDSHNRIAFLIKEMLLKAINTALYMKDSMFCR